MWLSFNIPNDFQQFKLVPSSILKHMVIGFVVLISGTTYILDGISLLGLDTKSAWLALVRMAISFVSLCLPSISILSLSYVSLFGIYLS